MPTAEQIIFTQEDWRVLDSLQLRNLSALKGICDEMSKEIIRELTDGINAGESIPKLSARIQKVVGMGKSRADLMARTETINAAVDGCRVRYEQAGIKEFEYLAASDARTCEQCASHNGKIYKLTDNANLPPLHPNCRCAIAPIVGSRKKEIEQTIKKTPKSNPASSTSPALMKETPIPLKKLELPIELPKIIVEPKKGSLPLSVYRYTGSNYQSINEIARKGTKEWEKSEHTRTLLEQHMTDLENIDDFLSDKVLAHKLKLQDGQEIEITTNYRGITGDISKKYAKSMPGDEITDAGFQSWTIKKDVADGWVENESTKVVLIQEITPGDVGYYLGTASQHPNEGEILKPRGLINIVDDINIDKKTGITYVTVKPKRTKK